jgi:hypothetical protein
MSRKSGGDELQQISVRVPETLHGELLMAAKWWQKNEKGLTLTELTLDFYWRRQPDLNR